MDGLGQVSAVVARKRKLENAKGEHSELRQLVGCERASRSGESSG